jgi:DNA-binding transcriptional ArsR family regulator
MSQPRGDNMQAVYRALHHPFRRTLLRFMDASNDLTAPVDYVTKFGVDGKTHAEALSYVSYHLRALNKAGLIDLVRTEPRRGAMKHFYRLSEQFRKMDIRDTLAMDQIATLLEEKATELVDGILKDVAEIVVGSGRPIQPKAP